MSTPITPETEETNDPVVTETPAPEPAPASAHPDPLTGEPGAHPVGVGVGALGAGAAGAAIGSIGGPIGMLIGAAIGAVAGGLAGKEVATTSDDLGVDAEGTPVGGLPMPIPGEGIRATGGSGFADEGDLRAAGTGTVLGATMDDSLPTPSHFSVDDSIGLEAPSVPGTAPLAGASMPQSGEEAVRVSAYYHYVGRTETGADGDAVGDWLDAEREMMLN